MVEAQDDKKLMSTPNPRRFSSSGEAVKELQEGFNDWSSILTKHSIEATLAIIAANWAVHGNKEIILNNVWSKWSLTVAIGFLGLNLLASGWITLLLNQRLRYADDDHNRWEDDFQKAGKKNKSTPWPYTNFIQRLGSVTRFLKVTFPIIAAILFIVSLFIK
ncbi:MAG: hypothetical protein A2W27_04430 [Deltaproteobacteria bacterium RBG_16_44_11]|nr:MAG: hypothetical protein A2W27_04430 [Deltaproteobacteria bacterium RBG_16_44_11]